MDEVTPTTPREVVSTNPFEDWYEEWHEIVGVAAVKGGTALIIRSAAGEVSMTSGMGFRRYR